MLCLQCENSEPITEPKTAGVESKLTFAKNENEEESLIFMKHFVFVCFFPHTLESLSLKVSHISD